jgi:hypothetical protein
MGLDDKASPSRESEVVSKKAVIDVLTGSAGGRVLSWVRCIIV